MCGFLAIWLHLGFCFSCICFQIVPCDNVKIYEQFFVLQSLVHLYRVMWKWSALTVTALCYTSAYYEVLSFPSTFNAYTLLSQYLFSHSLSITKPFQYTFNSPPCFSYYHTSSYHFLPDQPSSHHILSSRILFSTDPPFSKHFYIGCMPCITRTTIQSNIPIFVLSDSNFSFHTSQCTQDLFSRFNLMIPFCFHSFIFCHIHYQVTKKLFTSSLLSTVKLTLQLTCLSSMLKFITQLLFT